MPEYANTKLRNPPAPPKEVELAECDYAELDVTSNFSFLRGASHPDELVFRATELGYRAIAITDRNSLAGVVRAHDAARQVVEQGGSPPKLLIGARLMLADAPDVLVWAMDRAGYGRLCRLLTIGKRRAEKGECSLELADLLEYQEGLVAAIDDGSEVCVGQECPTYRTLREAMGERLSIASSCLYGEDDRGQLERLIRLSRKTGIALLATNNVHYHVPSRRMLQDVLTCIRHGCTIAEAGYRLFPNGERYLKSPAQLARLFFEHPPAIRRGLEIAQRCNFSLDELRYEYPDELVPAGMKAIEYLADLAWTGAAQRYPEGIPERVRQLIIHELELIEQLGFEAYFLTVYDLVKFARSRGILCQGRGSAANSAVCYCIGVTAVDPAKIDLLFERFISAARGEPPDIDIDFEHERREEVIQYIYEKYGRECAGMTAEVISYRGRSAVRDVGKAMGLSLDMVDQLAKKLDWWHRGTLNEEHIRELGLNPEDRTVRQVVDLTGQLLGFPRHLSQHVGGMVMTRGPLCELVPIENASMENRTVIEWDKDDIDALGILKVDVLGLGMLTCISKAFGMVNNTLSVVRGPLSVVGSVVCWSVDAKAPQLTNGPLTQPRTTDHGQLTSAPLQLHTIPPEDPLRLRHAQRRRFRRRVPGREPCADVDAAAAAAKVLLRPGDRGGDRPPGADPGQHGTPLPARRNGKETVTYPSEAMRGVLAKTLGVPLFQEQAMRVAMVGAGFSAGEADKLRRAMAAWRKSGAIEGFHRRIVEGMIRNGYTPQFAEQCFLQIRGFGEYGFPESHAASFALLVYVSAWLKRYHPAAFCAALLNSQPMGFYAPAQIVRDAREHGVEVRPADVNESEWDCTLESSDEGEPDCGLRIADCGLAEGQSKIKNQKSKIPGPAVRLGLRQIKGLRKADAIRLVEARRRCERFVSVEDCWRETGLSRASLRRLTEADAMASMGLSRREALWQVMALDDRQLPLFGAGPKRLASEPVKLPRMPLGQEVMTDYWTAGLSLKCHPVSLVRETLSEKGIMTAQQLRQAPHGKWARVAGLVLIRQRPGTASGIVFETLEDETGIVNLIIRPNIFDKFRPAARHAALLHAEGYIERQGDVQHVMVWRMYDLSHLIRGLELRSRDFH